MNGLTILVALVSGGFGFWWGDRRRQIITRAATATVQRARDSITLRGE